MDKLGIGLEPDQLWPVLDWVGTESVMVMLGITSQESQVSTALGTRQLSPVWHESVCL